MLQFLVSIQPKSKVKNIISDNYSALGYISAPGTWSPLGL